VPCFIFDDWEKERKKKRTLILPHFITGEFAQQQHIKKFEQSKAAFICISCSGLISNTDY
jgi:hypothetical protein